LKTNSLFINHTEERKEKLLLFCLLFLFLCAQFYFFFQVGARQSVDTPFYLENADLLMHGNWPTGRSVWYSGFAVFLALLFKAGGNLETVCLVQMLLSCLTAWCIYRCTDKISENKIASLMACLLYMTWIPIQEWNTLIYTESLFTSFCVLCFTMLLFARKKWHYAVTIVLFVFTFFIRPTGLNLAIALAGYGITALPAMRRRLKIAFVATPCILIVIIVNLALYSYDPIPSYAIAEIIYPKITLGVQPPDNLVIPAAGRPIERLLLFAFHNPGYFLKLFLIKIGLFYGNIKPYYSPMHNFAIAVLLYPLYCFFVLSLTTIRPFKKEKIFILFFVLASGLSIGLTSENWDGRFLTPVLPFIFILSSGTLVQRVGYLFQFQSKSGRR
jgi:hypothetical protein